MKLILIVRKFSIIFCTRFGQLMGSSKFIENNKQHKRKMKVRCAFVLKFLNPSLMKLSWAAIIFIWLLIFIFIPFTHLTNLYIIPPRIRLWLDISKVCLDITCNTSQSFWWEVNVYGAWKGNDLSNCKGEGSPCFFFLISRNNNGKIPRTAYNLLRQGTWWRKIRRI